MRIRLSSYRSLILLPLLLTACQTPRMATPPDLASAEVLEVSDRSSATGFLADESFNIGPYQVRKVKRGFDTSVNLGLGIFNQAREHQSFRFQFIGRQDWNGRCELKAKDTTLGSKSAPFIAESQAQLNCSCSSGAQSVTLQLGDNSQPLQGSLTLENNVDYGLRQEGFAAGLRSPTTGFRVEAADGRAVAAVELLYPGRIWRQTQLPREQHEPQACLLSALLIYGLGLPQG